MPPQARLTDLGLVPADAHGCPACPHTCVGPVMSASTDTIVNGLYAARITDMGVHAACCGPNIFMIAMGSSTVYINDLNAARLTDITAHCGGVGALITGSGNVVTGG